MKSQNTLKCIANPMILHCPYRKIGYTPVIQRPGALRELQEGTDFTSHR